MTGYKTKKTENPASSLFDATAGELLRSPIRDYNKTTRELVELKNGRLYAWECNSSSSHVCPVPCVHCMHSRGKNSHTLDPRITINKVRGVIGVPKSPRVSIHLSIYLCIVCVCVPHWLTDWRHFCLTQCKEKNRFISGSKIQIYSFPLSVNSNLYSNAVFVHAHISL